jgi:CHAD domain-containing protein
MAFELRPGKSTRRELERAARKELQKARKAITAHRPPGEEAIHDARKRVKKARAILLVVDEDHGRGLAKSAKRLRAVNRSLSCLRDADALIETVDMLRRKRPALFSEHVFARIRRELLLQKARMLRRVTRGRAWEKTVSRLRKAERQAASWRTEHDAFDALAPGLKTTHRRARKALARAKDSNAAADFHEWRKTLKVLWYELRLVGSGTPAIAGDIRALRSAERWLGDDHNLVVLCARLCKDTSVCRTELDVARIQRVVDTMQRGLHRSAIARTRSIFSVKPRDYVARVERAWLARQRKTRRAHRAAA